jgi:hypothetical protein
MLASYNELADEYANFSCGWFVVCHDDWDFVIKQFFDVLVCLIDLQLWIRYKFALCLAM